MSTVTNMSGPVTILDNFTLMVTHVGDKNYEEKLVVLTPEGGIKVTEELIEYVFQLDIPKCSKFYNSASKVYVRLSFYMTDTGITCAKFSLEETALDGGKLAWTCGIKATKIGINSRTRV